MGWTNLAVFGAGLGIGTFIGWWMQRSPLASKPPSAVAASPPSAVAASPPAQATIAPEAKQHALQSELQRTQMAYWMASEMAQFKSGFLARASHELRSPINSVISLHQLILSDLCEDPAEEREFVAQAYTAAEKMLALLDRLIGISKAVYGSTALKLQPLPLSTVLTEIEQLTSLQAKNRNLRLEVELPAVEVYVLADPRWFQQVLLSLLDTPISLMQDGYIRVTTQATPEEVSIQIADQRPADTWSEAIDTLESLALEGITQTAMAKNGMTDAVSNTPAIDRITHLPSSSLTLLMVQTLLELMGGRLEILSRPSADDPTQFTQIQCVLPATQPVGSMDEPSAS